MADSPFQQYSHCSVCGQPYTTLMGMGHVCAHPDPRIMAELKVIREQLDRILDKCQAILE